MIDTKKSKYKMLFTLQESYVKADLFQKVIQCLNTSEEYKPQRIAFDAFRFEDYEEGTDIKHVIDHGFGYVILKREKRLKYELMVNEKGGSMSFSLLFKDKMSEKKWNEYKKLSEIIIAAFNPDIAWLQRVHWVEVPVLNRTEELLEMMNISALTGNHYEEYGPGGLGLITYLGEDFVSRLGIERVMKAPIKSNKTSWGATALSLADNPCEASEEELAVLWESAMDYFSPANFFAISMPSLKKDMDGFELYGDRGLGWSGYQGFRFWFREQFTYEAKKYMDCGDYEKAVGEFTEALKECANDSEILQNRAKAYEMLGSWEEAIKDLTDLIESFTPAFDMVGGWCKKCNDFLVYDDEEYEIIDQCMRAGYWPYRVSNRGYVYVKRKWHLEPGNIKNTDFKDLPDSWCCPYCDAPKRDFITQRVQKKEALEQAQIYMNRGKLFEKLGNLELAKADFDKALSLDICCNRTSKDEN